MKKIFFWGIISAAFMFSCKNERKETKLQEGMWRGTIALNDSTHLPFNFNLEQKDSIYVITILNGEEEITVEDIERNGDSLMIKMPVFANYFEVHITENRMDGYYINPDADNYRLPFNAMAGDSSRFKVSGKNCCDINEKWAVKFSPGTADETPAIAYFQQEGTSVAGTFLTETGDYRYLQGVLDENLLQLSAFDGAHLFYFKATIDNGQKMTGRFFSGRSWSEPWIAYRDDDFELRDPDSLTYLKEGYSTIDFSFPDLEGKMLSLNDKEFKGKPVIIQIMGSWCSNCMDESRYLREVYKQYYNDGLRLVGLTFERARNRDAAVQRAQKMKRDLDLPYPILMAGYTREDKAGEALPMLNHIMSFPTTIYLDREHKVLSIHTGFSGPGTPVYDEYTAKNKKLIEKLLHSVDSGASR